MPAGLVKILLLMAGIEPNPGPVYICPVCLVKLKTNSTSVQCNYCLKWVHHRRQNNCSELTSTKEYDKSYKCPSCRSNPTFTSAALPQPVINPTKNKYTKNPASQQPPSPPLPPPPLTPPTCPKTTLKLSRRSYQNSGQLSTQKSPPGQPPRGQQNGG